MSIHIGEKIKQRAKQMRIGVTELGRSINTSKQNMIGIYKRKSIDTLLLQQLSKSLDYDFFQYYQEAPKKNSISVKEKQLADEITRLKKQFQEKEIGYLKKINDLLEKRKGK